MTELSLEPGTDDDTDVQRDRSSTTGTSRWQKVGGIIGLIVVLWVGDRMTDVVFGDGPGGDTPIDNQQQEIDIEDDGGHNPSQGNH